MTHSGVILLLAFAAGSLGLMAGCVPTVQEPSLLPAPVTHTARLVFIGDVMSHSPQVAAARTSDGFDYSDVFRHVHPLFDDADVVVANLETTLRSRPPYTGYPMFAAPAELAFAMRRAGIDIVTTANNHICDKGAGGIRSTIAILDSAGIRHTGAFADSADHCARNPLRFTAGGVRFALLNYTYGTNGLAVPKGLAVNLIDTALIARDLAVARTFPTDCVIVCYHWGEEYRTLPTRAQRELAAWTKTRGADIIIGTHPHVVEPFEAHYNADSTAITGATFYSLGNFVSNQRVRRTDGGMAAEITVTKTEFAASSGRYGHSSDGRSSFARKLPARERFVSAYSLPARTTLDYGLAYRLFWVHMPVRDGVRRYEVLPSAAADTIHDARRFFDDARKLLSAADTVFTERR